MLKFIQTSFIAITKNYSDSITFLDKINFCLFMLLHELSCSFLSCACSVVQQTYCMTQAVEIKEVQENTQFLI